MSSVRDSYRSRDYHKGTGSRVFLTEIPGCYNPGVNSLPSYAIPSDSYPETITSDTELHTMTMSMQIS
jgi:hypothetical protein